MGIDNRVIGAAITELRMRAGMTQQQLAAGLNVSHQAVSKWEKGGGYIGVERRAEGEPFEYYIGMLTPENTPVPDGFVSIDFKDLGLGTCWIYGKENEVHDTSACKQKLAEVGMEIWQDENGAVWSFENCLCPRYTTPDENGNIILDYSYFITSKQGEEDTK